MDCGIFSSLFKKRHGSDKVHIEDNLQQTASPSCTAPADTKSSLNRHENGRSYHNRADVAYVLPNDERENDRVHLQHWLLKELFGDNFSAPIADKLEQGIKVQDAGCGPGTWTLEMATQYPRSAFTGTDVSSRFPEAIKPVNCQFQVHNLLSEGALPGNHFGYIHQRFLILGILEKDWEKVIKEHVRTLAPGGWLECMELPLYRALNSGPNYAILNNAWNIMGKVKGLDIKIPDHLEGIFERAGLVNIDSKEANGPMDNETQYGRLAWEDFREVLLALKPLIVKANPELDGDDRYMQFLQDCLQEFIDLGTTQPVLRIWGQKPLGV